MKAKLIFVESEPFVAIRILFTNDKQGRSAKSKLAKTISSTLTAVGLTSVSSSMSTDHKKHNLNTKLGQLIFEGPLKLHVGKLEEIEWLNLSW